MAETAKKFLDYEGLQYFIGKLVSGEVKGKGLSANDFTDELLNKLNSTATTAGLESLTKDVNDLKALIEADSDGAINKFNEIVAFLAGIEDTQTLKPVIADVAANKAKLADIEAGAQKNTVTSVAGKTGAVTLTKTDVGLDKVNNTADLDKPISTATQEALDKKADSADIPTELPNPEDLVVTLNGGTTEGTDKFSYNGSASKTVNITAASVGAMTSAQLKAATFAAGKFAAKSYTPTAATTINVPTNTSHLNNDSGYITQADIAAISNAEIDALIAA